MPTWEAKKTRSWKVKGTTVKDFSHDFYHKIEHEISPYLKESFLRLLAESKDSRMNSITINISMVGKRLNRVV